jgi:hypothetical protein
MPSPGRTRTFLFDATAHSFDRRAAGTGRAWDAALYSRGGAPGESRMREGRRGGFPPVNNRQKQAHGSIYP